MHDAGHLVLRVGESAGCRASIDSSCLGRFNQDACASSRVEWI